MLSQNMNIYRIYFNSEKGPYGITTEIYARIVAENIRSALDIFENEYGSLDIIYKIVLV